MDSEPSNDRLEEVLEELRERTDAILEQITEDPEDTPERGRQLPATARRPRPQIADRDGAKTSARGATVRLIQASATEEAEDGQHDDDEKNDQ